MPSLNAPQLAALSLLLYPFVMPAVAPFLATIGVLSALAFVAGLLVYESHPAVKFKARPRVPSKLFGALPLGLLASPRQPSASASKTAPTSRLNAVQPSPEALLEDSLVAMFQDVARAELTDPLLATLAARPLLGLPPPSSSPASSAPRQDSTAALETLSRGFSANILGPRIAKAAHALVEWRRDQVRGGLEQRFWVQALTALHGHVKQYKKVRREVLREVASKSPTKGGFLPRSGALPAGKGGVAATIDGPRDGEALGMDYYRHLDEFNEFAEDEDDGGVDAWDYGGMASLESLAEPLTAAGAGVGSLPGNVGNGGGGGGGGSGGSPRHDVEEINTAVVARMATSGSLHPALGFGPAGEQAYLRSILSRLWHLSSDEDRKSATSQGNVGGTASILPSASRIIRLLMREWIACQLLQPLFDRVCQPDYVNQYIIDKTQKRLVTQKAVKAFRSSIDSHFSCFPPLFLRTAGRVPASTTTLAEKARFLEPLAKYCKKVRSLIDAKAIRHQIASEIRRRVDDASAYTSSRHFALDSGHRASPDKSDGETMRRFIKSLTMLKLKYEKRIAYLTGINGKLMSKKSSGASITLSLTSVDKSGTKPSDGPVLTIRLLLDEYMQSEEKGVETSTGLYYFLEFMEHEDGKQGIAKVQFWLACEKYRKLLLRLQNGVSTRDSHGGGPDHLVDAEGEAHGIHSRLRKEASKIHRTFLVSINGARPLLELDDPFVTSAIESFIASKGTDTHDNDFKTILIAQDLVFRDLEDDLRAFAHSDSYFAWTSEVSKSRLREGETDDPAVAAVPAAVRRSSLDVGDSTGSWLPSGYDLAGTVGIDPSRFDLYRSLMGMGESRESLESPEREFKQSALLQVLLGELESTCKLGLSAAGKATGAASRLRGAKPILTSRVLPKRSGDPDAPNRRGSSAWASLNSLAPDGASTDDLNAAPAPDLDFDLPPSTAPHFTGFDDEPDLLHAPGELLVNATKLQQLRDEMDRVMQQIDCLSGLAALVPPDARVELCVLDQTKDLLREEIGALTRQRARYLSQEQKDAITPGQCTVRIESAVEDFVGREGDGAGKIVTFYLLQIDKEADMSGWSVRRRYSDFHALHRRLKDKFPVVTDFELPGKTLGLWPRGKQDLKQARMKSLEKYLQRLMDDSNVCQSDELRTFLSSSYDATRRTGIPDPDRPDEPTTIQRTSQRIARLMGQSRGRRGSIQNLATVPPAPQPAVQAPSNARGARRPDPSRRPVSMAETPPAPDAVSDASSDEDWGDSSDDGRDADDSGALPATVSPLAEPLCALMMELYEFKDQSFWLRRNAAVMILKQCFGGQESLDSQITAKLRSHVKTETLLARLEAIRERIARPVAADDDGLPAAASLALRLLSDHPPLPTSQHAATQGEAKSRLLSVWPGTSGVWRMRARGG
ncbi:hypothetical protein BDK51DRAFT_45607 [Blyttiomyces helicus]|uniref:PX domain-containing protein n=1 Tax=Blyttiomyces helicus TaxID=388810 RepID=A0A4P9WNY5_9FUNG|nr:hypothetical protein BDK51DRAFT_45607 [Blyttiomyces helicus]|eukprot:RKO93418.1 hypothetical protein BDK51DRAFT_45607 [Blyttiomyces helicus]